MQPILQCPVLRSSTKGLQTFVAIPIGLAGGYLLVNMLLIALGDKPFFGKLIPAAVVLFLILIVVQIVIWYRSKGTLMIYRLPDGEYKMDIRFPNGIELVQKGKWDVDGSYTKTYAKYGMYSKNLALALYCNDKPFCLLRHQLGGVDSPPRGFIEVGQLYNPSGTEFWCKKAPLIFAMFTAYPK